MRWTTEVVESIHQVDRQEWDDLVRSYPFADWRWLQVTEAVLTNHRPRYVLLRQGCALLAGAICSLQSRFESRLLQSMFGWFPLYFPVLRCGVPIAYDPGLFFREPKQAPDLLPELFHRVGLLCKQARAPLHSFDHLSPGGPIWPFLQERGYHRVAHLTETVLNIRWEAFDDYLKSLTSKKRVEYRRTQGHLEGAGILIETADPQTEDNAVLYQLVKNVFQRHGEPVLYDQDVFRKAAALMGDDFKLIVARQHGQTIGCMAILRSGEEWMAKWAGLDYDLTLNTGSYYGLLAECVRQAIEAGGGRLRLGATAYQTKRHFGVTVEERIGALAVHGRPFHWLAGKMLPVTANPDVEQAGSHPTGDERVRAQ